MGTPAAVAGDLVVGMCPVHLIPDPLGLPMPAPPLPFSAPLEVGCVLTVLIGGRPAAVMGSTGLNEPPHTGLHPADPFEAPIAQIGEVLVGSPTVYAGGRPLARAGSAARLCTGPGLVVGSVVSVEVA